MLMYPALQRMLIQGRVMAEWGVTAGNVVFCDTAVFSVTNRVHGFVDSRVDTEVIEFSTSSSIDPSGMKPESR
jgi:hypothetical protein